MATPATVGATPTVSTATINVYLQQQEEVERDEQGEGLPVQSSSDGVRKDKKVREVMIN